MRITFWASCFILASCASAAPVVRRPLPSPVVSSENQELDEELIAKSLAFDDTQPHRVGPGDTLLVVVYNHPELALSTYAGVQAGGVGGRGSGFVIDNDGTIQLPLIGTVSVEGKTTAELKEFLERELARYIKSPKVTIQVLFMGSIRYHLLGQFTSPGLKFSDRPMRLLQALSLGGTVDLERASLRSAYVSRREKRLPVNFLRLIRYGDMTQNIPLESGDVVVIPDSASDQVFVFGGVVGTGARTVVPFVNGQLDILQALSQAGFGFRERAQGVLSETRIIRSEGDRGELIVVNVDKILEGKAASFSLRPGDVIFVPTTTLTNWNFALQQLLPSLQTVSAILNPFVQIQFLAERLEN